MRRARSSAERARGLKVSSKTTALPQKRLSSAPRRLTNSIAIRCLTVFSMTGRATAEASRRAARGTLSAWRQKRSWMRR